jgi:hypothetical protein
MRRRKSHRLFRSTAFSMRAHKELCWDISKPILLGIKIRKSKADRWLGGRSIEISSHRVLWGKARREMSERIGENGGKYLPFQFVYKFSTAPPLTLASLIRDTMQIEDSWSETRKGKTLISPSAVLFTHERWDWVSSSSLLLSHSLLART